MSNTKNCVTNKDYSKLCEKLPPNGKEITTLALFSKKFIECQNIVFKLLTKYRLSCFIEEKKSYNSISDYYRVDYIKDVLELDGFKLNDNIVESIFDATKKKYRNEKSLRNLFYGAFINYNINDIYEIITRFNYLDSIMDLFLSSIEKGGVKNNLRKIS